MSRPQSHPLKDQRGDQGVVAVFNNAIHDFPGRAIFLHDIPERRDGDDPAIGCGKCLIDTCAELEMNSGVHVAIVSRSACGSLGRCA